MAITTFAELKTAVAAWSDASDVSAYLDDFVTLTTSMFNHGMDNISAVRTRDMMTVVSLTPTDGICTLPADYLQYRRVVDLGSNRGELEYITPGTADGMYPDGGSGIPANFTIVGNSLYIFPISTNNVELTYFASIPDLSVSNTTNWLLTKHPSLYLHGCLLQLGMMRREDDLVQRSSQLVAAMCNGLRVEDQLANYARASTMPRGRVVI